MIAKGIKRGGYACTTIQNYNTKKGTTIAGNFALSADYLFPFHVFSRNGSQSGTSDTNALIPLDLIDPDGYNEFMRHANMFTKFRIRCIRWEFTPINAITGRENVLPSYAGAPRTGPTGDEVAGLMDRNTSIASAYWVIRWPDKNGSFQSIGSSFSGSGPGTSNIRTDGILSDPKTIKVPLTEKLVLFWKPKVMGMKVMNWIPTNAAASSNITQQSFAKSSAKPFPWTDIIDNVDGTHTTTDSALNTGLLPVTDLKLANLYNTTGLRQPMTQPWIALYDASTQQFVSDPSAYVCGEVVEQTVFEFKRKRNVHANMSTGPITETARNYQDNMFYASS